MASGHPRRRASKNRQGFSLAEVLIAVGILTILIALLLPLVKLARDAGRRAACGSNLRQIGLLIHAYAGDNGGEVPAVYGTDSTGSRPRSWFYAGLFDRGDGAGGMLLLVAPPVGVSGSAYARDAGVFVCPGERAVWQGPQSEGEFLPAVPGHSVRAMSYDYDYVPPGGDVCHGGTPSEPPVWEPGVYAGFERHNVARPNAAATAILSEQTAFQLTDMEDVHFHGLGGNVLYLDGHVVAAYFPVKSNPRGETPEGVKAALSKLDGAAGG